MELWPHDAPELFEPARLRPMRDIYDDRQDPGQIWTSYVRGRGEAAKPGRYDAIYVSPHFEVREVRYMYDEAIEAGSDHGLVFRTARAGMTDFTMDGRQLPSVGTGGPVVQGLPTLVTFQAAARGEVVPGGCLMPDAREDIAPGCSRNAWSASA